MQTEAVTERHSEQADQLSPGVERLVNEMREAAETRVRTAIERRTEAERDVERFKSLCAAAPDDQELDAKRRQARALLDDAIDRHEIALAARESTFRRLDEARPQLLELSKRDATLESVNDPAFQAWSSAIEPRIIAAVAELCAALTETKARSEAMGAARSEALALAEAAGLTGYRAPLIEHDRRVGVLRRAAHAALRQAGLHHHDLRDLFVGY